LKPKVRTSLIEAVTPGCSTRRGGNDHGPPRGM